MYIARVSDKAGKALFVSRCHDTPQAAAREALAAQPKAKIASTSHAYWDGVDWREQHSNIQWYRRDQLVVT